MAGFDPSIISQIPDMGPNPVKATQDAMTLYDTKNRVQLNALTLQQAKEEQSDHAAAKKILQASDLSTDKGKNEALEKVSKVSPDLAMKMDKDFTAQKGQNLQNQLMQLEMAQQQTAPMINTIDSIISDLQPMKKLLDEGKITQADLDAAAAKRMLPAMQQIKLNSPQLGQYIDQFAKNPQNLTYHGLVTAENQTKNGREMAKQRSAEIKQAMDQQRLEQGDRRLDIQTKAMESLVNRRNEQNKNDEMSHLTPETANLMADQYLAGDKTVLTGLGRTKGDMAMARNAITARAKEKGMSGAEIAAKIAEFNASMAELRKISNIAGGVEFASSELKKFIPIAEKASDDLPRGKFLPMNKLIQMGEKNISDPKLRALYVNTQSVLNAYDVLAARGGSDRAKREENRQMLLTADSKEVYKTALANMMKELEAASEAAPEATKAVTDRIAGKKTAAPAKTTKTDTSATDTQKATTSALSEDDVLAKWAQ